MIRTKILTNKSSYVTTSVYIIPFEMAILERLFNALLWVAI